MQELTSLNLRFFLALNHDLYKGKVVGSLQLAKNKNKFMGRVKSLDVRCNDALLMVRHFLANQLTYFYVYYIYIYTSLSLVCPPQMQFFKPRSKTGKFFGELITSSTVKPLPRSVHDSDRIQLVKVRESKPQALPYKSNFPDFNFPG